MAERATGMSVSDLIEALQGLLEDGRAHPNDPTDVRQVGLRHGNHGVYTQHPQYAINQ
jgi:hypothetical protein